MPPRPHLPLPLSAPLSSEVMRKSIPRYILDI
jgi:hypothetical protein